MVVPVVKLPEPQTHKPWPHVNPPFIVVRMHDLLTRDGKRLNKTYWAVLAAGGFHDFLSYDGVILLSIAGYFQATQKITTFILCAMGILLSIVWAQNIESYKKLNKAKFKVLQEMEEKLPMKMFTREQEHYHYEKRSQLTKIEKSVPLIFGLSYLLLLIFSLLLSA